jgi:predicted RNA-binding protein with PUA domain
MLRVVPGEVCLWFCPTYRIELPSASCGVESRLGVRYYPRQLHLTDPGHPRGGGGVGSRPLLPVEGCRDWGY